ncbi:hypothetical protein B0H13DRAFT_2320322 [Mycena leptocephala]|nr:hypothetical protein B0H13DRAFT_2320322 [Mycena leptocephala]
MLRPPPPCAERSYPHLRLARKPATVYASSHTTQLAYARVPHVHPQIRPHRSTDLHTFRPPPIYRHVRRTFHLDLVQPPPPRNARPLESRTHREYLRASSMVITRRADGGSARSARVRSITRADVHTPRRHPHPHAHAPLRLYALAIAQSPLLPPYVWNLP